MKTGNILQANSFHGFCKIDAANSAAYSAQVECQKSATAKGKVD